MPKIIKEKSAYGNMNYHLIIEGVNNGINSSWFKTKKEAEYELERYINNQNKYTK